MHQVVLVLMLLMTVQVRQVKLLSIDYYTKRCPVAETIISTIVRIASWHDPSVPAALLRLHYHDCFVGGCDASILLDYDHGYPLPEKMASPNQSLRGYELVDSIKKVLEFVCPSTVSCADILALATRDAVLYAGGPHWDVLTGRRDGRISSSLQAEINLPHPYSNFAKLRRSFIQHGLSEAQMISLSGAHTIGYARCASIWDRLYNYRNYIETDPRMDAKYAANLRKICPRNDRSSKKTIPLDPVTPLKFDNMYYKNLGRGLGLLASDDQVGNDSLVLEFARNSSLWAETFREAMMRMSNLNVKEEYQGEVRRNCRSRN